MTARRTLAFIALVLSVIWYRSGDLIKNCILIRSPFPQGFIVDGEYVSDCTTISTYADRAEASSLNSCEDGTFWELHDSKGKVVERPLILSCDPSRKVWNTVMGPMRDPDPRGALWIYIPPSGSNARGHNKHVARMLASNVPANKAYRISFKNYPENHDFHPLGVEIWPSHAGNSSNLYVINHARERTVIEHFIMNPARPTEAVHVRTISSPYFLSPNGLALTSPDAFYTTNDHLLTRRMPPVLGHVLPVIESVFGLPLGFVLHVTLNKPSSPTDGAIANMTIAKSSIAFPNGIAVSPSGEEVVIASSSLSKVVFFERDPRTDTLKRKKYSVSVPFSPDNVHYTLSLDAGGKGQDAVIVAGHPNFLDLTAVAGNKTDASAASWVVAIVPKEGANAKAETKFDLEAPVSTSTKIRKDGDSWTLKTLFQSHGIESKGGFGASTTGLRDPDSNAFYVGGLYAKGGFLVCRPASGIGKK